MSRTPSVDEVVEAFRAIDQARVRYRELLRDCVAAGPRGTQAELARRLGRTREAVRRDTMEQEVRSGYTYHGHWYGSGDPGPRPAMVAKCGGPTMCDRCREDVRLALGK